jgi:hypothetical protein
MVRYLERWKWLGPLCTSDRPWQYALSKTVFLRSCCPWIITDFIMNIPEIKHLHIKDLKAKLLQ